MTEKNEALRLAEVIPYLEGGERGQWIIDAAAELRRLHAAAELRRLHAEDEESEALRERLSALLTSTAIALRGPAPELVSWSWHDLPERAAALVAQRDALLEALRKLDGFFETYRPEGHPPSDPHELVRAAIKKAEEA